jgi:threonine dehydrogenase-like Zn-dependent dehydrogenase
VLVAATGAVPMRQAVESARPGGRVVSFAATSPGETAEIDFGLLTTAEKDILTAYSSSIDIQEQAAQLVFTRAVRVRELISHRFDIADGAAAFALALQPAAGTLKVVLQMDGAGA